jgi:hypothetical protein
VRPSAPSPCGAYNRPTNGDANGCWDAVWQYHNALRALIGWHTFGLAFGAGEARACEAARRAGGWARGSPPQEVIS